MSKSCKKCSNLKFTLKIEEVVVLIHIQSLFASFNYLIELAFFVSLCLYITIHYAIHVIAVIALCNSSFDTLNNNDSHEYARLLLDEGNLKGYNLYIVYRLAVMMNEVD